MSFHQTDERKRAAGERARSRLLRIRAAELCEEADLLSAALVTTVSNFDGRPIGGSGDSFALRLPALPVMLGFIRRQLGRWLEGHGVVRDDAADITLACSEACANAMEHPLSAAQPAVEIRALLHAEAVELVVRDFGSWSGRSEGSNRGRGLEMIRALVDEVTIARHECGTTVTIRRRLRNQRAQASSAEIGTST